ncbi:MAG: PKD domain-containing protein, partial [Bacteroidota bacterium]
MKRIFPFLLFWCVIQLPISWAQTCDITVSPGLSFCGNSQVNFSATTSLDSSAVFTWTFGDGAGATGNPVQHNYGYNNGDQTFTVTLTATDTSNNTCTVTETVTALYHPQITFGGPTQLCLNDSTCNDTLVQGFNLSTTAPGPFIWNWNDGNPPDTTIGPSINHTFIGYGNNPVTVTAQGSQCPSVVQPLNFFNEPTRPILDLPIIDLCPDDTAVITIIHNPCPNNISYYVVYWDFPNTGPGQVDTFPTPGTYTHLYDLPCNNIATQNRSIYLFPVNPCYPADPNLNASWVGTGIIIKTMPVPDFGANPNPGCWPDDSVVLFTNSSCPNIFNDPLSFTWTFGDPGAGTNDTSTLQFPSHIYPGPGTYPVTLTASNNACGARSITQNVVIDEIPEAAFTTSGPDNCVPATFTFTNGSTPTGATYLWEIINVGGGFQFSGGTDLNSQNPEITFTQAGTYIVQLTTSNPPCGQAVFLDTIVVFDVPTVSLTPQPDSCDVVTYQMSGAVVDNGCAVSSYLWDFGPNASPTTANTLIPPPVTFFAGTHTVSFSATNCCGTTTQ